MKRLWILYITVGIGAFLISFTLEYIVFKSITGKPYFAFFLTLVLESAKILTVIFHRFISDKKGYSVPEMVSYLNTFFKVGLIFLSLVCSIAIISKGLDRPLLDSVKEKDESRIKSSFDEKLSFLSSQRQLKLDQITGEIKQKYEKRFKELDSYYLPRISKTEKLRDDEFKNVGKGGLRKGPYWNEYNRQLVGYQNDYKREQSKLRSAENSELEKHISKIEDEFQEKVDRSLNEKDGALSTVVSNDYKFDERTKNPIIASFLMTMDEGLNLEIDYLSFAILISLLVSLLIEITIYLTFSYVVMFYNNILTTPETEFILQEVPKNTLTDENPVSDGPLNGGTNYGEAEYSPSDYEFFQNLQNQFGTPQGEAEQFENPCAQEKEGV